MLTLIMVTQVLTYQGEEMEEDEETMADYDIQVGRNVQFSKYALPRHGQQQKVQNVKNLLRTVRPSCSSPSWPVASSATPTGLQVD